MNFELSDEQRAFRAAAREFAEHEFAPNAAAWDADSFFPVASIRHAGELGYCGVYTPEALGGMGLSRLDASMIFEELARADPSTTAYLTIHNMATWMVATWGSPEFAAEWVPQLASGRALASYCLTESGAGSDAASIRTRALRHGDHYLIDGSKAFISGAGETELLVIMARTGEAGSGGISAFAVPSNTPGIAFGKREHKMGWNSQPTRALAFDGVKVPLRNRLGDEGEGFRIAMKGLDGGRINIATCSVGAAQGALDATQRYMGERKQFQRPLGDFQGLQFKLADMVTELVSARQMVRLAAAKLDSNDANASIFCAMAKRIATDIGFTVCNDAMQLHGGYGYIREYPLERLLRDVRVHQILEGTNEIMRVIVARHVLTQTCTDHLS